MAFPPRIAIGWVWLRALPAVLRGLAIGGLAVALARPQTVGGVTRIAGQGVAIVVALDQSSSMNAVDFPADRGTRLISRLEAAKTTFTRFVEGRSDDLIGLVVFANYPELACPPILDHAFLIETVAAVRSARPGDDGTNIGDAIAVGLDALLIAPPKKKVLVLLTDGNNEPAVPRAARSRAGGHPGPRPGRDPAHDRDRPDRRDRPRRRSDTRSAPRRRSSGPNLAAPGAAGRAHRRPLVRRHRRRRARRGLSRRSTPSRRARFAARS